MGHGTRVTAFSLLSYLSAIGAPAPTPKSSHDERPAARAYAGAKDDRPRTDAKTMPWAELVRHACRDIEADIAKHPDIQLAIAAADIMKTKTSRAKAAEYETLRRELLFAHNGDRKRAWQIAKQMRQILVDTLLDSGDERFRDAGVVNNWHMMEIGKNLGASMSLETGVVHFIPDPSEGSVPVIWGDESTKKVKLPNGQTVGEFVESLPRFPFSLSMESLGTGYRWTQFRLERYSKDRCREWFAEKVVASSAGDSLSNADKAALTRAHKEHPKGIDEGPLVLQSVKPFSRLEDAATPAVPPRVGTKLPAILTELGDDSFDKREAAQKKANALSMDKLKELVLPALHSGDLEIQHRFQRALGNRAAMAPGANAMVGMFRDPVVASPSYRLLDQYRQNLTKLVDKDLLKAKNYTKLVQNMETALGAKVTVLRSDRKDDELVVDVPFQGGVVRTTFDRDRWVRAELASAPKGETVEVPVDPAKVNAGFPFGVGGNRTSLDLGKFAPQVELGFVLTDEKGYELQNFHLFDDRRPSARVDWSDYILDYLAGPSSARFLEMKSALVP